MHCDPDLVRDGLELAHQVLALRVLQLQLSPRFLELADERLVLVLHRLDLRLQFRVELSEQQSLLGLGLFSLTELLEGGHHHLLVSHEQADFLLLRPDDQLQLVDLAVLLADQRLDVGLELGLQIAEGNVLAVQVVVVVLYQRFLIFHFLPESAVLVLHLGHFVLQRNLCRQARTILRSFSSLAFFSSYICLSSACI